MTQTPKLRTTRQRMLILEELRKVDSHPTAEELYFLVRRRLPRISLGTVYRNLDLLSASNEICKMDNAGHMRRFDAKTWPHQHIRCTACGKLADVCQTGLCEPDISALRVEGFQVNGVRVEYEGLCAECAAGVDRSDMSY